MVVIGKKYPYAFVHVPKTGGNSVYAFLCAVEGRRNLIPTGNEPLRKMRQIVSRGAHSTLRPNENPSFCFAFFRDPVDRWLSYYRYLTKIRGNPRNLEAGPWILDRLRGIPYKGGSTDSRVPKFVWETKPQEYFVREGFHIYKASNAGRRRFKDDFADAFGLDDTPALPHLNKTRGADATISHEVVEAIYEYEPLATQFFQSPDLSMQV